MDYLTPLFFLLAQDPKAAAAEPGPGQSILPLILPVGAAIVLYYFMIIRPERAKQGAHRSRVDQLKKNDRVVTIGGIYGVVMDVRRDSDEVVLKIDEATNTKIKVTYGAIGRVLSDEPPSDKPA